jgi:hypothetical protein
MFKDLLTRTSSIRMTWTAGSFSRTRRKKKSSFPVCLLWPPDGPLYSNKTQMIFYLKVPIRNKLCLKENKTEKANVRNESEVQVGKHMI